MRSSSALSASVSSQSAATTLSVSSLSLRIPTRATVTAGLLSTQAIPSWASDRPCRHLGKSLADTHLALEVVALKQREPECGVGVVAPVALIEGMARLEGAREQAETECTVGHEADVVLLTIGEHAFLHAPVEQVIANLVHSDFYELATVFHHLDVEVRYAAVADLAIGFQFLQSAHRLFEGGKEVGPVSVRSKK